MTTEPQPRPYIDPLTLQRYTAEEAAHSDKLLMHQPETPLTDYSIPQVYIPASVKGLEGGPDGIKIISHHAWGRGPDAAAVYGTDTDVPEHDAIRLEF